ncbi:MAG TPA: hypothetical protein VEX11_08995 [Acetobacteraceae bacterium]|nr:hypothetical protein [Acetobacteraceae bacterium]
MKRPINQPPRSNGLRGLVAYLALFLAALCTKRQSDLFPSALMFSC